MDECNEGKEFYERIWENSIYCLVIEFGMEFILVIN